MEFEICAQEFNLTNRKECGAGLISVSIDSSVNSPSFGKITFSQGDHFRIAQVAAKFMSSRSPGIPGLEVGRSVPSLLFTGEPG
jgi:hypothetical protein